jgi:ketosteroid isomerase-like protein
MGAAPNARVRSYYRLVDLGDLDALVDLFAEDAEYHRPGYSPISGRAQIRSFYEHHRVIETGEHVVDSLLSNGCDIAVRGSFEGALKDGSEVSLQFADFFQLRQEDQRFVRRDTFFFVPLV